MQLAKEITEIQDDTQFEKLELRGGVMDQEKLTPDRVDYFCHPDWVVGKRRQPPKRLWLPQVPTEEGLKATAAAYREKGWL